MPLSNALIPATFPLTHVTTTPQNHPTSNSDITDRTEHTSISATATATPSSHLPPLLTTFYHGDDLAGASFKHSPHIAKNKHPSVGSCSCSKTNRKPFTRITELFGGDKIPATHLPNEVVEQGEERRANVVAASDCDRQAFLEVVEWSSRRKVILEKNKWLRKGYYVSARIDGCAMRIICLRGYMAAQRKTACGRCRRRGENEPTNTSLFTMIF